MEQSEEIHVPQQEIKVCKLICALYGLREAPQAQYEKIDTYLQFQGLYYNNTDPTCITLKNRAKVVILYSMQMIFI